MTEIWKDIEDFPDYRISNLGRVYSLLTGLVLKTTINSSGYCVVNLRYKNKTYMKTVHRLVARAFIKDSSLGESYLEINHKDSNRSNNRLDNLEYTTSAENRIHAITKGNAQVPRQTGENNQASILTKREVLEIKSLVSTKSVQELANSYGVSTVTIHNILNKKKWKHV